MIESILDRRRIDTKSRAEIHQALLSHFSLLAEILIAKVLVKFRDSKVSELVNLTPEVRAFKKYTTLTVLVELGESQPCAAKPVLAELAIKKLAL
jgi:hypothetical protein